MSEDKELVNMYGNVKEFSDEKTNVELKHSNGIIQYNGLRITVEVNNSPSPEILRRFALNLNELLNCKEGLA